ncbi:membrane-bound PQQ-dependent dehydrogenase, glucose/quinate/shikimate family [Acinetobacter sp. MD2]|uniref:membrane-bound PQQ-dependent dehydrogenase, glucose/quinate/shikimate family n=1 Tax=Acinetobacter sp. MD2 TaxID=2600066 RepID=UPI002D1F5FBE|nr:membrane-bound PQQ-dependent dehydrogenase, glucose/quinate/shikimate family [Acinetobacter sp. MD2]MEB3766676.1 membrane-bound PQQ-dependent dehydrogenase, glucose/quinate/shikimate family [Acinetobacter sp. MD2]
MNLESNLGKKSNIFLFIYSLITAVVAIALLYLGVQLVMVGGSWYYLIAGVVTALSSFLVAKRHVAAIWLFAVFAIATFVWGLSEAGWDGWALLPRYNWIIVLGFFLWALQSPLRKAFAKKSQNMMPLIYTGLTGGISLIMLVTILIPLFNNPHTNLAAEGALAHANENYGRETIGNISGNLAGSNNASSWTAYGGSNLAQKFSPAKQITPDNVAQLQQVWSYDTKGLAQMKGIKSKWSAEAAPLVVDGTMYSCNPMGQVFALDAKTGQEKWRVDPKTNKEAFVNNGSTICRGVSIYKAPQKLQQCQTRILWGTMDSRLLAVDAQTGEACRDFGHNGTVNLNDNIGKTITGFVAVTSPPAIIDGVAVIGHKITDGEDYRAPSGLVRAFDAVTGQVKWVWDPARPLNSKPLTGAQNYRQATPNVWTIISADDDLHMVYLGTGNASGDFYGAQRTKEDGMYNTSVVAVDSRTGAQKWKFQTVHHDVWDFDIGPQPTLTDWKTDKGNRPALIQATKSGEIFVLDRETGKALMPIKEIPVPTDGVDKKEKLSPTQPISAGMPNTVGAPGKDYEKLTEASTWGISPFDQAMCRIQFHKMRYDGLYTPPTLKTKDNLGSIGYPGNHGGMNWGGMSINPALGIMVINTERLPYQIYLINRDEIKNEKSVYQNPGHKASVMPQIGLPYGAKKQPWMSPLNMPCIAPPWGYLAAVDMRTKEVLWKRPLGTGYDQGPMGIPSRVKLDMGTPSDSGSMTTAGGLTFIGAAMDNFMRAFDVKTGKMVWEQRLDAGAGAMPISYEIDGRQYIAAYVGGNGAMGTKLGDKIVVWALPEKKK